jgi:two-component sensor histidine kinase
VLEPTTAQTVAISLHELATNAAKYESLSVVDGRVEIAWSRTADGRLSLRWIELGGPTVTPPTHRGFGTRVIENTIGQLRGEVQFNWRDRGLACEIALLLAGRPEGSADTFHRRRFQFKPSLKCRPKALRNWLNAEVR